MKFSSTYNVRSSEITPDYALKDYFIGMYFQECFAEYAVARKCAAPDLAKIGLTWLIVDGYVEFYHPMPFWREPVGVSAWIYNIGALKIRSDFEAYSGGRKIAAGATINLIADIETHRPQKTAAVADKFEILAQASVKNPEPFAKIEMFDNGCCASAGMNQIVQNVRFDDLDFNMHLNNVRYIPRALEAVDIDYRLSHSLHSYRIKFEKEARFGDAVESTVTRRGDKCVHILSRQKDGAVLCQMQTIWQKKA